MCNNDYTLITKEISNLVSEKNIVIWKSEMDGLGTSLSDIDAYCICDEEKNFKNFSFNGIPVDIEYIGLNNLKEKLENIDKFAKHGLAYKGLDEDLKLFYRLERGHKSQQFNLNDIELPTIDIISKIAAQYYNELFLALYEDAFKMFHGKNFLDAFILSLEALQMSVATYLARIGKPQFKKKWLFKYFDNLTDCSYYEELRIELESDTILPERISKILSDSKKILEF